MSPDFIQNALTHASEMERSQRVVPPLLHPALTTLEEGFDAFLKDDAAQNEFRDLLRDFVGRPTALSEALNLSKAWGCRVLLKREDLAHGGAHKLNNALGQCFLARYMGFRSVIAETGAGQHGVATAIAAAKFGLACEVFQGAVDVERQALNAQRMRLFGARLTPVHDGSKTLNDAVSAALRAWVVRYTQSAYCLGSITGPHPYPRIVRHFQKVIGEEAREQLKSKGIQHPTAVFACVGGGSNAAGLFSGFAGDGSVALYACEAAGAASLVHGRMGTLHGMESLILQTPERNVAKTHSLSAGLDYPGVGPWLAGLKITGRLQAIPVSDDDAVAALEELAREEGILCALESAHAVAGARQWAQQNRGASVLIGISGRGDKDLEILQAFADGRTSHA
jgi:tryptophan synthase beta chain